MAEQPSFPGTQCVGIVVFDNFEPIDVFGFVEAFAIARFLGKGYADPPPHPFATVLIGQQPRARCMNGPTVLADWDFDQALKTPPDVLMIPGGMGTWALLDDSKPKDVAALLDWVRAMDKKVPLMASVCTGAAVLARAGLFENARHTSNGRDWITHHMPDYAGMAHYVDVPHAVADGRIVSAPGSAPGTFAHQFLLTLYSDQEASLAEMRAIFSAMLPLGIMLGSGYCCNSRACSVSDTAMVLALPVRIAIGIATVQASGVRSGPGTA